MAASPLSEGLSDAIGFVGGALAGWQLGRWLGYDLMAGGPGFSRENLIGWICLLAGLAAGKWASQAWQRRRRG